MENPMQHNQSKLFVSNMMESAIRIGLLFILIVWTYDIIKPFVIPVLWGAIIAVALMPLTNKLEKALKGRRGLAATILALAGITLLIAPFVIVSSSLIDGISHTINVLQSGEIKIPGPTQRVADIPLIGDKLYDAWALFSTNLEKAVIHFLPQIKSTVGTMAGVLGSGVGTLVMSVISLAIAGGFMAHAEKSAAAVSTVAVKVVGKHGEEWTSLTAATIRSVLLGVVGVAFIQAVLIGSALFTFSIPAAGLFTFIIFILGIAQLPPLLVVLPLIFYVFSTQDSTPATIFTVWVLIAGVSDSFLKPMLMGRGVDVPMPVILIGAIGGMISAGIIGLFLGAVVLAIWYELFITWLNTEDGRGKGTEQGNEDVDKPLVSAPAHNATDE